MGDIFVAVWNKIYSMQFLKNNILFDEKIWYGEGMLFNIDCLQFVDSIAVGEKSVYHQVSNPNSAMRKFNVEQQPLWNQVIGNSKETLEKIKSGNSRCLELS